MTTPQPVIAVFVCPSEHGLSFSTLLKHAEQLATQLNLPLIVPPLPQQTPVTHALTQLAGYDFGLQVSSYNNDDYQISLKDLHLNTSPINVNFSEGKLAHRRLYGGGRKQPLARAVGLKPGNTPVIVDATAGLARDAFVLACLGCRVMMIERSPILATLIADGMRRALLDPDIGKMVMERMSLRTGDAKTIIETQLNKQADVVYLDPMYPTRSKSALVKKEMRILRSLIGDDMDSAELLSIARVHAKQRVVVKRPRLASLLMGPSPGLQIESKSTRYDIYLSDSKTRA